MDGLNIRVSKKSDKDAITEWLLEGDVLKWFPMTTKPEIEDSINICMDYIKNGAMLTAEHDEKPCGMACLYLQYFKKFAHQCLFVIIIKKEFRSKGVGSALLRELMKIAKEKFHIEILHLEVYSGNPARAFYERFGFKKYGIQEKALKENNKTYVSKILMQKYL